MARPALATRRARTPSASGVERSIRMMFSDSSEEPSPLTTAGNNPMRRSAPSLGPPRRTGAARANPLSASSSSSSSPLSYPTRGASAGPSPAAPSSTSSSSVMLTPPPQRSWCYGLRRDAIDAAGAAGASTCGSSSSCGGGTAATRCGAVANKLAAAAPRSSSSSVAPSSAASSSAPHSSGAVDGHRLAVDGRRLAAVLEVSRVNSIGLKSALSRLDQERASGQQALAAARTREERLRVDLMRRDAMAVAGAQQVRSLPVFEMGWRTDGASVPVHTPRMRTRTR